MLTDSQPFVLDTLAMAYAEAGRFGDARDALQKAIEIADATGQTNSIAGARERLRLFQAGSAYRESFTNRAAP